MAKTFRVRQFAELAGVTVKALRHYDRLGLLRPVRNEAGYRLYQLADLARLQQIVALKSLGLPLKQIRPLLDREPLPLVSTFRQQRAVLEDKRQLIERAIHALSEAETALSSGASSTTAVLQEVIRVMAAPDVDVMKKSLLGRGLGTMEAPLRGLASGRVAHVVPGHHRGHRL